MHQLIGPHSVIKPIKPKHKQNTCGGHELTVVNNSLPYGLGESILLQRNDNHTEDSYMKSIHRATRAFILFLVAAATFQVVQPASLHAGA